MSAADLLIAAKALGLKGDDLKSAAKMLNAGEEDPVSVGIVEGLLHREKEEEASEEE
jgi:hypothetical protein